MHSAPPRMSNMSMCPPMPFLTDGMLRAAFQYVTSTPMQHVQKQLQFLPPRNLHPQYLQQRFISEYPNVRQMFAPPPNPYRSFHSRAHDGRSSYRPPRRPSPSSTISTSQSTRPSQPSVPTRPPEPPVIQEQPALPFGDVDEFPILLSAAGGLVALHGASCQYTSPSSSTTSTSAFTASTARPAVSVAEVGE